MIVGAVNGEGDAVERADDAAHVGVEAGFEFGGDRGEAVLGAEDEVGVEVGEGVGHGRPYCCWV